VVDAALSATGRKVCAVDVLCPSSYKGATPSGWWDFCDAPATARAEPLSYCALNFFDPACQAANVTLDDDLKNLGRYLAVAGSNYSFSFLGVEFTKTVLGGGVGSSSTSRGAALGAANSPGIPAVELARAILASTIPLTSALGLTVSTLLAFALALLLKSSVRLLARLCARRRMVPLEEAVQSAAPKAEGTKTGAYTVPLSKALQGVPARGAAGEEVHLVGRTFSIRAQPQVYQGLSLLATLGSAHVELKPEHLELAEMDGVFEDDAPGLLFLAPLLWEPASALAACAERLKCEGVAELPTQRSCPEGYKERLRRWVEQQPGRTGKLDKRLLDPAEWETWVYDKEWAGPPASATAPAAPAAAYVLHDFAAIDEGTLSVQKHERVVIVGEEDADGWIEVLVEGTERRGLLPATYLGPDTTAAGAVARQPTSVGGDATTSNAASAAGETGAQRNPLHGAGKAAALEVRNPLHSPAALQAPALALRGSPAKKGPPPPAPPLSSCGVASVLHHFDAAGDADALTVRKGERVVVLGGDGEWVDVRVEGAAPERRGVVPASYVRLAWATTLHDFAATDEDTLSVHRGQRVVVVAGEDAEGWVEVHAEGEPGRRGLVPAAYIRHENDERVPRGLRALLRG
jgi:hypothetical protein